MDYDKYMKESFELLCALHNSHKENQIQMTLKGELFVLFILDSRGDKALPGELAEIADVSTARIAAILKSIEKKGLLKREIDAADRRKILVTLTPEGITYCQKKKDEIYAYWKKLMDALGEEDVQNSIRIMKKFLDFTKTTGCYITD